METDTLKTKIRETSHVPAPRNLLRRLRARTSLRELTAETRLHTSDLIMPHFIAADDSLAEAGRNTDLPALSRITPDQVVDRIASDLESGLGTHLLFGIPDHKDPQGSTAWDPDGPVPMALRSIRKELGDGPNLLSDVCLCGYTDHGHCGVLTDNGTGVDNDATLPLLARMALTHAEAGADMVCPSDMMDARVQAIRDTLDKAGCTETGILSYSTKFASAYYGPFRTAADSTPMTGDRRGYQLDPRNAREAVREALLDEQEGADALMVKPALAYLDVIHSIRQATRLPLAAYHVSGEYALNRLGASQGLFEEKEIVMEQLTAIKRAGADWIITYHARDAVQGGWIR